MGKIPSSLPPQVKEEENSFSQVQMEGAEISRVGEKGQEWVLSASFLEQKGNSIFLTDVSGVFFQEGVPLYQVKAQKGQIKLPVGDAELEKVELINEDKKEALRGELLSWRGNEEKFELNKAQFESQGIEAHCQLMVYDLSHKKLKLENGVEFKVKVER